MITRRCRDCINTFKTPSRHRRLCPDCRQKAVLNSLKKHRDKKKRRYRKLLPGISQVFYKKIHTRIQRALHHRYKLESDKEKALSMINEWEALIYYPVTTPQVRKNKSRCWNCAYYLMGETVCPRCGK